MLLFVFTFFHRYFYVTTRCARGSEKLARNHGEASFQTRTPYGGTRTSSTRRLDAWCCHHFESLLQRDRSWMSGNEWPSPGQVLKSTISSILQADLQAPPPICLFENTYFGLAALPLTHKTSILQYGTLNITLSNMFYSYIPLHTTSFYIVLYRIILTILIHCIST